MEDQIISLVKHGISCLTAIACVYIIGQVALPIVVRVLEHFDSRENEV